MNCCCSAAAAVTERFMGSLTADTDDDPDDEQPLFLSFDTSHQAVRAPSPSLEHSSAASSGSGKLASPGRKQRTGDPAKPLVHSLDHSTRRQQAQCHGDGEPWPTADEGEGQPLAPAVRRVRFDPNRDRHSSTPVHSMQASAYKHEGRDAFDRRMSVPAAGNTTADAARAAACFALAPACRQSADSHRAHADSFRGLHQLESKHKAAITGCCFSEADSEERVMVCTVAWDNYACLYDATTGKFLRALKGVHTDGLLCCSFFHETVSDRDYLCVGGVDKSISLYRTREQDVDDERSWETGFLEVLKLVDVHTEGVTCCCVSDERLCLGSWDRTAALITFESLTEIFEHANCDKENWMTLDDTKIAKYEFKSIKELEAKCPDWRSAHIKFHKDAILCCRFSKSGERFCLGSQDKTASVWNVQDVETSEWLEGGLH